jgi:hypothetical protein
MQILTARFYLSWQGIAIFRGAAFDYVRDVNVSPFQTNRREEFFEESPGRPDERSTLLVFVEAGTLAHEHDLHAFRALAWYSTRARLTEIAVGTG